MFIRVSVNGFPLFYISDLSSEAATIANNNKYMNSELDSLKSESMRSTCHSKVSLTCWTEFSSHGLRSIELMKSVKTEYGQAMSWKVSGILLQTQIQTTEHLRQCWKRNRKHFESLNCFWERNIYGCMHEEEQHGHGL